MESGYFTNQLVKNMTPTPPTRSQADRSAETRARILKAAVDEFAGYGLAGSRTDRIAQAAGVNKALLYYYFESKEKLYDAAFEMVAAEARDSSMAVFFLDATPGERIVRTALRQFDRILSQTQFQTMMQQEMMRLHQGESQVLPVLMQRVFAPVVAMFQSMVREAVESGEFIDADWLQVHISVLGSNVFYFMSSHIWRHVLPIDPFDPEVLRERRISMVRFLGMTLFNDRQHGLEVAERVLADTPMPEGKVEFLRRLHERA